MPYNVPQYQPPRLKRSRPVGHNAHYLTPEWRALRKTILIRDKYQCRQCGVLVSGKNAQCDHIIARADGGTDAPENLQTLCSRCHGGKGLHEHRKRK